MAQTNEANTKQATKNASTKQATKNLLNVWLIRMSSKLLRLNF